MVIPKKVSMKNIKFESGDGFSIEFMTGQELINRLKDLDEFGVTDNSDIVVYGWQPSRTHEKMVIEMMTLKELKRVTEEVWGFGMLQEIIMVAAVWTKKDGLNGPNMNLAYDI